MPWHRVEPMDNKYQFIKEYKAGYFNFAELCRRYGVSRKTGYKWVSRWKQAQSIEALKDLSRRPVSSPTRMANEVIATILERRGKHPHWGPKKLLTVIHRDYPGWELPSVSTVARILKHNGLIKPRRSRVRKGHPGPPLTAMSEPNAVWTADFKGHFKTGDGVYCYPLTVVDGFSRYLLACQGMLHPTRDNVKAVFTRLFNEFGLPVRIRTDNGSPFAAYTLGRLSKLSIWWIKLGIIPELIEPGCPQQNGRHERMHRTLKQETVIPPAGHISPQQRRFNRFREEYNTIRPHESIDLKTPAQLYRTSYRAMPKTLPPVDYPSHFEKRLVSRNGGIRWKSNWVSVGQVLEEEYIGLEAIDNGIWDVYFSKVRIGRFIESDMRIEDINKQPRG